MNQSQSSKQLPNVFQDRTLRFLVAHSDEDRVFTCERAYDFGKGRVVNLNRHRRSTARKALRDQQYLSRGIEAEQSARRISISVRQSVPAAMFDDPQLFQISRHA